MAWGASFRRACRFLSTGLQAALESKQSAGADAEQRGLGPRLRGRAATWRIWRHNLKCSRPSASYSDSKPVAPFSKAQRRYSGLICDEDGESMRAAWEWLAQVQGNQPIRARQGISARRLRLRLPSLRRPLPQPAAPPAAVRFPEREISRIDRTGRPFHLRPPVPNLHSIRTGSGGDLSGLL